MTGKHHRRVIAEARLEYVEMRDDRDYWRRRALDLIGIAEDAADLAEETAT